MWLNDIINSSSNYIKDHKLEIALDIAAVGTIVADHILTYYGIDRNPGFEMVTKVRDMMNSIGIEKTLLFYSTIQVAILGLAKATANFYNNKYDDKFFSNLIKYGTSTYLTTIHTIGILSNYFDMSHLAKLWQ